MKSRMLDWHEAEALIRELRAMAALPAGPAPAKVRRAKEIRYLLARQPGANGDLVEKADHAHRLIETLLSARRWRAVPSLDFLRKDLKSACERLKVYAQAAYRRAGRAA